MHVIKPTAIKAATYSVHTDDELISQFLLEKDETIIRELYVRYAHLVYGQAAFYKLSPDKCQEICLQTYEILLKYLPKSKISSFKNWLFTTVKNLCIQHLKNKGKDLKISYVEDLEKNSNYFMENNDEISLYNNSDAEVEQKVVNAIETLDENQKRCIRLFYFDEKSYKEIAEATNLSLSEVKSHLQNGKRNLKNLLQPLKKCE